MRLLFGALLTLSIASTPTSAQLTPSNMVFVMSDDHAKSASMQTIWIDWQRVGCGSPTPIPARPSAVRLDTDS
jgi:hypothetical protein